MRIEKYFENIQQDLKLFFFLLLTICLYRGYFMWYMSGYMGDAQTGELLQALWAGLRLSLKSAGAITLLSFVFCTLVGVLFPRWRLNGLRLAIGSAASFVLAVLFQARFPYYREYGMTYGLQVVQGIHDDRMAIFWMAVQEYGLLWRLAIAVGLSVISFFALRSLLRVGTLPLPQLLSVHTSIFSHGQWKKKLLVSVLFVLMTFTFGLFVRFGGSFNYAHGLNWENAGVTKDAFLNECILDDIQAMYRVHSMEEKMAAGNISGVDKAHVRELAVKLSGRDCGEDLQAYLRKEAQGARLPKPKHIFIILGETYAQWPMIDEYAKLHAADGIRGIMQEANAYSTRNFMPNGDFTSVAITGLVTGLSEINIRVNYQGQSFKEVYPTSMAKPFQELGYAVDFWYGGIPSWDNMKGFAIAQGFDHFYGYPDYHARKQNAWGTTDKELFAALSEHLAEEAPTVHLVMTVSNHPPYDLDLAAEGFDLELMKEETKKLPNVENPEELAVELGHYWYMDKMVTEFVRRTMEKYPDSLFVITGDHAVRMNPSTRPTIFEQQSVPFVLYGQGVTKDILPPNAVGGHTSIVPTLLELIAPKGFGYFSIAESMTKGTKAAFNRDFWMTEHAMGAVDSDAFEALPGENAVDFSRERQLVQEVLPSMRTISWQLLTKGTKLP